MLKLITVALYLLSKVACEEEILLEWDVFKLYEMLNYSVIFDNSVSIMCRKHVFDYVEGIMKGETWAVMMFDSMEKFPAGILAGRRLIIGQYDECIQSVNQDFKGQHCMIELRIKQNSTASTLLWIESGVKRLKDNQYSYGICVPSTCNATEIKNIFLALNLHKVVDIELNETSCTQGSLQEMRNEDWIMIFVVRIFRMFLMILIFLSTASTIYDLYYKNNEKNGDKVTLLTSFSVIKNFKNLFQINNNPDQMRVLNGIRFLSITWVLLGHVYSNMLRSTVTNFFDFLLLTSSKTAIPMINAYLSVDSFFFMSGFLVCFVFFRDICKKGGYDVPVAIIHRYLRLTPTFAVVFFFQSTIFSRLGSGPIWKTEMENIESNCQGSWWSHLFYMENYMSSHRQCLGPSWYLCADMQMFLLSPFILYVMLMLPKFALIYLVLLTLGASIISFATAYYNGLPPNKSFQLNENNSDAEENEYRAFHTRMAPWLIGIATGYILCGIQSKKINFQPSKFWVLIGWFGSILLLTSSLYGIGAFQPPGSLHSPLEISSYRAFHRVGWALSMAWILLACLNEYGGPVNSILSLDVFQPLAKLSYSIFLIHKPIQIYRYSNDKEIKYFSNLNTIYTFIGDLVISILFSIPLTLLCEMPFINIDKYFFQNVKIFPYPKSPELKKITVKKKKTIDVIKP